MPPPHVDVSSQLTQVWHVTVKYNKSQNIHHELGGAGWKCVKTMKSFMLLFIFTQRKIYFFLSAFIVLEAMSALHSWKYNVHLMKTWFTFEYYSLIVSLNGPHINNKEWDVSTDWVAADFFYFTLKRLVLIIILYNKNKLWCAIQMGVSGSPFILITHRMPHVTFLSPRLLVQTCERRGWSCRRMSVHPASERAACSDCSESPGWSGFGKTKLWEILNLSLRGNSLQPET